jgi:Protein of unknown function (DUF3969)
MKKVKFPEFKSTDRWNASQLVAVMSLGLCVAIKDGTVSIKNAEQHLFNPWMLSQLTSLGTADAVLEVIHLGTELSDVEMLIPHALTESLEEMKAMLASFLLLSVN